MASLNEERIMQKVRIAQAEALKAVADVAIASGRNFMPIWRGDLRRDIEKVVQNRDTIYIKQSGKGTKSNPYAKAQYFGKTSKNPKGPVFHAGSRDQLQPLTIYDPKKTREGRKRKLAAGDENIYSRAYRHAKKTGKLKRMNELKWWSKVINDEKILSRMFATYRRFWRLTAR